MTADEQRRLLTFWADLLGCTVEQTHEYGCHVVSHGSGLQGYNGAWVFDVGPRIMSVPLTRLSALAFRTNVIAGASTLDAESLNDLFGADTIERIVGPCYVGYLSGSAALSFQREHRTLGPDDTGEIERIRRSFGNDWTTSGLDDCAVRFGVFEGHRLAAVSGYEVWGALIAHLCVFTAPAVRQRGHGTSIAAAAAAHARRAGLIPQWRTLFDNLSAMKIAQRLGFERLARYYAVRFR